MPDNVGTGTALDVAVRLGHMQVVELLLTQYISFYGIAHGTDLTYLGVAVTLLYPDLVDLLLKLGAVVSAYD